MHRQFAACGSYGDFNEKIANGPSFIALTAGMCVNVSLEHWAVNDDRAQSRCKLEFDSQLHTAEDFIMQ